MDLTQTIKIILIKRKMTVTQLSVSTNQSQSNLTHKLQRNDFRISDLEKIANALDCELSIKFIDNQTNKPII